MVSQAVIDIFNQYGGSPPRSVTISLGSTDKADLEQLIDTGQSAGVSQSIAIQQKLSSEGEIGVETVDISKQTAKQAGFRVNPEERAEALKRLDVPARVEKDPILEEREAGISSIRSSFELLGVRTKSDILGNLRQQSIAPEEGFLTQRQVDTFEPRPGERILVTETIFFDPETGFTGPVTGEERQRVFELGKTVEVASRPEGFLEELRFDIQEEKRKIPKSFGGIETGGETLPILKGQFLALPLGIAASTLGFLELGKSLPQLGFSLITQPITTLKMVPGAIRSIDFEGIGRTIFEEPGFATGFIAAEFAQDIVLAKAFGKIVDLGDIARTRISPSFRKVEKTGLGADILRGVTGKADDFDIGLIPRGTPEQARALTALDIDIPSAIFEADIPLKSRPKLPSLTKGERAIVNIARTDDAIITGSLAQETLLRKQFTRGFEDIDILAKDPEVFARKILELDKGFVARQQPTAITISKRGKDIVDIVDIKVGEGGFASKFDFIDVGGVKFVDPKARLGGKLIAFKRRVKLDKTLVDIEALTGGVFDPSSPLFKGGFGFSEKELGKLTGVRGTVTTSAQELFDKRFLRGLSKETTLEVGEQGVGLFVSLPDPKTLMPLTRKSFLETGGTGSILDILRGEDLTFKRPKPQIVFFEDIKIGRDTLGKRITPGEFEDVFAGGKIIRRTGKKTATVFGGKRVEIIGAEIVEPSSKLKSLIETSKKGDLTFPQSKQLNKRFAQETGFDIKEIVSRPDVGAKFISPTGLGVSVASKVKKGLFFGEFEQFFDTFIPFRGRASKRGEIVGTSIFSKAIRTSGGRMSPSLSAINRALSTGISEGGISRRRGPELIKPPLIPIIDSPTPTKQKDFLKLGSPQLGIIETSKPLPRRIFQRTPSFGAVLKSEFGFKQPQLDIRLERTGLVERAFQAPKIIRPLGPFKI